MKVDQQATDHSVYISAAMVTTRSSGDYRYTVFASYTCRQALRSLTIKSGLEAYRSWNTSVPGSGQVIYHVSSCSYVPFNAHGKVHPLQSQHLFGARSAVM